ncbi:hypothetical protein, partial [Mesorhizobium sp. M1C.F.Ca.ET.193.01.1.1]|uniref:hypothetical protein n=1 Tax=Mesorhizobium sp. M1C.F.Ca.ET.193.01.1.1 TaxID=2563926 RepID=UPI001AEEE534
SPPPMCERNHGEFKIPIGIGCRNHQICVSQRGQGLPESQWRELAAHLIQTFTGLSAVDPQLVEGIIRK